jgi:arylsulfatase
MSDIVHDAEYYVARATDEEAWVQEDSQLTTCLAEIEADHGGKPNLIHIMWDDMAFGDLGIPALRAIRGFEAPNLDRMAEEGILFTGYRTEAACTPSRAAVLTGWHPVRSGMAAVGWPLELRFDPFEFMDWEPPFDHAKVDVVD